LANIAMLLAEYPTLVRLREHPAAVLRKILPDAARQENSGLDAAKMACVPSLGQSIIRFKSYARLLYQEVYSCALVEERIPWFQWPQTPSTSSIAL
jgi:hypothetical protein